MKKVAKLLLTTAIFFSLSFFNSPAFAQDTRVVPPPPPLYDEERKSGDRGHQAEQNLSDPEHAFDSKTGQNLYWDCVKKTWIDAKTGKALGFKGARTKDGEVVPPPPPLYDEERKSGDRGHQAEQNLSDPEHAFDSKTGQNLYWDRNDKTWKDSKTGKSIGFQGARIKEPCPSKTTIKETPTKTASKDFPHKDIFVGFSLIREDNGSNGFNTYGGELAYTRNLCRRGGITGDVGVNFGSYGMVDYTKINVLAGGTYYPIKTAVPASDFNFSVHALAGLSNIKSSYSGNSFSKSYFTMDAGVGFNYYFGDKTGVGLRIGYMPTFSKGNTSNNIRLGLGLDFR